jgi:hypothetical protein
MQNILSPSPSSLCGSSQQSIWQKCARRELDAADDVCVKPNGDLDEFISRCVMSQCIAEQKTLVQESCGNNVDWNLMASFLSPDKPPLHPSTKICHKSNIHSHPCRFGILSATKCRCLCIACAGISNAKPNTSQCLVCGATILLSICQNKTSTSASPSSNFFFGSFFVRINGNTHTHTHTRDGFEYAIILGFGNELVDLELKWCDVCRFHCDLLLNQKQILAPSVFKMCIGKVPACCS